MYKIIFTLFLIIFSQNIFSEEQKTLEKIEGVELLKVKEGDFIEKIDGENVLVSSCSIRGEYCNSCSISCDTGEEAVCSPGRIRCQLDRCWCQTQPRCRCR